MTDQFRVTPTSSDAELISAARSGDARACDLLRGRHAASARLLACLIKPGPAEADEVVAETFAGVLAAIRGGSGPAEAFRPYLLTAVRRVASDHPHDQRSQIPADDAEMPDPGGSFAGHAEAGLERSLIVRAFRSLPERWAAVLWHAEIERARPAEVALLLGISPNGVAALTSRAREGLGQSILQLHLSGRAQAGCRPVAGRLAAYARNGLSRGHTLEVFSHLNRCRDCGTAHAALARINEGLRELVAPAILGEPASAYLAHLSARTAGTRTALHWLRMLLWRRPVLPAAAGVAVAVIVLTTASSISPHLLSPRTAPPFGPGPPGGPGSDIRVSGAAVPAGHAGSGRPAPPQGSRVPLSGGSSSASATPSPTSSVTASPTPSRTGPPSPQPTGTTGSARLSVSVSVSGLLNLGVIAVAAVKVSDSGTAPTSGLTATLALPAGITSLGPLPGSSGWTCSGTSCDHGPIAARAASTVSFRILVASLDGCGRFVAASAVSGTLSASGSSAAAAACGL